MDGVAIFSKTDDEFRPLVLIDYEGQWLFTTSDARQMAADLVSEAAIADIEAALMQPKLPQGFSLSGQQKAAAYLLKLRECRPQPRPKWANAIFGMKHQKPFVQVLIDGSEGGRVWLFEPDEARHIAALILHCAEASETDAFLRKFLQVDVLLGEEETQSMIDRFRRFREVNSLENLL